MMVLTMVMGVRFGEGAVKGRKDRGWDGECGELNDTESVRPPTDMSFSLLGPAVTRYRALLDVSPLAFQRSLAIVTVRLFRMTFSHDAPRKLMYSLTFKLRLTTPPPITNVPTGLR